MSLDKKYNQMARHPSVGICYSKKCFWETSFAKNLQIAVCIFDAVKCSLAYYLSPVPNGYIAAGTSDLVKEAEGMYFRWLLMPFRLLFSIDVWDALKPQIYNNHQAQTPFRPPESPQTPPECPLRFLHICWIDSGKGFGHIFVQERRRPAARRTQRTRSATLGIRREPPKLYNRIAIIEKVKNKGSAN